MKLNKLVVLVDGSMYNYRVHFGNNGIDLPSKNTQHEHLYDWLSIFQNDLKVAIEHYVLKFGSKPDKLDVVVAFDDKVSPLRTEILEDYKANRTHTEFDFLDEIKGLLLYTGCRVLNFPETEADDIIGFLCNDVYEWSPECFGFIVSDDLDYLQLVTKDSWVWRSKYSKLVTKENFKDKYKCESHNYVKLKSLEGDKSDNIPRVVAPKVAKEMIHGYEVYNEDDSRLVSWLGGKDNTYYRLYKRNKELVDLKFSYKYLQEFNQGIIRKTSDRNVNLDALNIFYKAIGVTENNVEGVMKEWKQIADLIEY